MGRRSKRYLHMVAMAQKANAKLKENRERKAKEERQNKERKAEEERQQWEQSMMIQIEQLKSELREEKRRNKELEERIEHLTNACTDLQTPTLPSEPNFIPGTKYCDKVRALAARIIKFSLKFFPNQLGIQTPVWTVLERMTGINERTLRNVFQDHRVLPITVTNFEARRSFAYKMPPCQSEKPSSSVVEVADRLPSGSSCTTRKPPPRKLIKEEIRRNREESFGEVEEEQASCTSPSPMERLYRDLGLLPYKRTSDQSPSDDAEESGPEKCKKMRLDSPEDDVLNGILKE